MDSLYLLLRKIKLISRRILIANRGEMAMRAIRACKSLNHIAIAIYSEADAKSMHVLMADESICIGPSKSCSSYRNIKAILSAADVMKADAIYPGYGFLSENPDFARAVEKHKFIFIGPSAKHIHMMGNKIEAKKTMQSYGIDTIPGTPEITSLEHGLECAKKIGFPVLVKAAAGGGGKGMRVALTETDFTKAYNEASQEAEILFGDQQVYIEKYLNNPRHIEFQVLSDQCGNVIHLGERECSIQRRNQKLWEEAPSIVLSSEQREEWGNRITEAIRKMEYVGAGTLEFLYEDNQLYFMEMNTRIQVEHSVSELITSVDIVRWQIRIAFGAKLDIEQKDISIRGHAIECRINAEDPVNFQPSPGLIENLLLPSGPYIRVDTALYTGYTIPSHYDSLIAKLIARGEDRYTCILNLQHALKECTIVGCKTLVPFFQYLITESDVREGNLSIKWLDQNIERISGFIKKHIEQNIQYNSIMLEANMPIT